MRRVIREVITLIRIERWLVVGEEPAASATVAEELIEQIVLSEAEAARVYELLIQYIVAQRLGDVHDDGEDLQ